MGKKYWNDKKNESRKGKKKEYRANEVLKILTTQNPEDLTNHPHFPEFLDGESFAEYANKIERYWARIIDSNSGRNDRNNERKSQTSKRKMPDQPDKNEKNSTKKRKMEDFTEQVQKTIYNDCMKRGMTTAEIAKKKKKKKNFPKKKKKKKKKK